MARGKPVLLKTSKKFSQCLIKLFESNVDGFSGFDDRNLVVCIRHFRPLTKFEKMWNSPCVAIEDPFDLKHNLGNGLSARSNQFNQVS